MSFLWRHHFSTLLLRSKEGTYGDLILIPQQLSVFSLIWLQLGRNLCTSDSYLTQVSTLLNELYHFSSALEDQRRHTNLTHHHHHHHNHCHHPNNSAIYQDLARLLNDHLADPHHQNYNGWEYLPYRMTLMKWPPM